MQVDIVIVGGGISGLHTAYELEKQGVDYVLLEARDRLGGRILSRNYISGSANEYNENLAAFDLGPSWFWPGQNHIETLVNELNLVDSVFTQESRGESVYEDKLGNIQQGFYGISMQGAYRLQGGIGQIVSRLKQNISSDRVLSNAAVEAIEFDGNQLLTKVLQTESQTNPNRITSNKIVLALPPRSATQSIIFNPPLSNTRTNELNSYSTWMAGHAKILFVYETPFWLKNGLSGDAISQLGPIREIHDASSDSRGSKENRGYALFGFLGVPGSYRKGKQAEISQAALDQLIRLYGEEAANPMGIVIQDWAQEAYTATEIDLTSNAGHATSSMSQFTEPLFDNRLIWSGTESAHHLEGHNGLLEGALEASVRSLELLI